MKTGLKYFCALCAIFLFLPHSIRGQEDETAGKQLQLPDTAETDNSEFDFSEREQKESEKDDFSFSNVEGEKRKIFISLPLRGSIKPKCARQTGSPKRWSELGVSLYLTADAVTDYGQFYAEGRGLCNAAYRIEDYSDQMIKDNEFNILLREAYWKQNFGPCSLSGGNIIRSRSSGDILSVSDKLIVVDRTEYLFSDIEDVTSGQNMAAFDFYAGSLSCGIILIPYALYDRIEDGNHPYSISPGIELKDDGNNFPEQEMYISFRKEELSIQASQGLVHNRMPIIKAEAGNKGVDFYKLYKQYLFTSLVGDYAMDPVLIKAEAVYNRQIPIQARDSTINLPAGHTLCDRIDFMGGVDLSLGRRGILTWEFNGLCLIEGKDNLKENRNRYNAALSWSNSYINESLTLSPLCMFLESYQNTLLRLPVEYDTGQNLSVKAQYTLISIHKRKESYEQLDSYDRVDLSLEYGFSLY